MIKIIFRNLEESVFAKEAARERLQSTVDRFPDLKSHKVTLTLSMDNSSFKAGPDLFRAKLLIAGTKYKNIVLEKSAMTFYQALAELAEHTLERLNRFGDRRRVKRIKAERALVERNFLPEDDGV